MRRAAIIGWGHYTPPAVLSNADLASVIDTSDEWITTRSGIKERRISHVSNSDMATAAARQALACAGLDASDMDLIVVATCSPDRAVPSVAAYVQRQLGGLGATMDLNAACSGFVYGRNAFRLSSISTIDQPRFCLATAQVLLSSRQPKGRKVFLHPTCIPMAA